MIPILWEDTHLIFCCVRLFIQKAKVLPVGGGMVSLIIQIIIAVIILTMSVWGIVTNTPINEVQRLIEQSVR
ncbi:hypothetical protein [Atopobium fossor]|uniref:hypothetical protein n=1 Tax=Atopobium fossor TaxID=39487 RepID=UPI0004889E38|nr:hypothetical protein [Atopobium fossor]